uniref:ATP-dependent DNA helicase n=1 Tax=Cajanus cajan TaxID=3821 RepID=A0A151SKD2_CAJCA|nr:hypothetical protein KK1_001464 [Cajanus cajan]
MLENPQLHESIVSKLQQLLHQCNPFVHVFKQLALRSNVHECSLLIKECPDNQPQYHLSTASQVAAIIVGGDIESMSRGRDINLVSHDGNLVNIQETVGYYDPLQYPLLLPFGTYGWDFNTKNDNVQNISCREYYNYITSTKEIRPNDQSTLLKFGRLLQQYVVDNYVKIELGRLRWIRNHQNNIRAEVYQGLQDALHEGETMRENIGQRTILPSSFIGSRRDLTQRYEDGMAIVLNDGKPDIFLTMTCNPSWSEISSQLGPHQTPPDRLDLLTRIFRSKFGQLKEDVINKGVIGKVKRGTGKTFLYRTLIANVRSKGQIVLATASSGIAATLLPGGRTAHSRFKIPINVEADSFCSISKQSDLAKLIRETTAIIWDEAPMTNRYALEALDRSLKDLLDCNAPFGGKIMILGGDFRQVLPVVPKGTKAQMIYACIVKSHLWPITKVLHLRQNMRSLQDPNFAEYLMRIGDGNEPTKLDDMVKVPHQIEITWEGESSIQKLIRDTFPQLESHTWNASYMVEKAILTPKNEDVQKLNDIIINHFLGEERHLLSFDEVEGDTHNLYQQEYLHSITPGGFPPHNLKVKKYALLMLLRNIDPKAGLCNGTRLLCRGFFMNMLDVEILTGHNAGKRSFLPRIKSEGQTIPNVGIYLPRHVFSHGQLYVALSRGVSQASKKILIKEGKLEGEDGNFTKNIIFKEILLSQNQGCPLLIYNNDGFRLILDNDIQKLKFVSFIFLSTVKLRFKEILQLYEEINRKNLNMYFGKKVSDNIFIHFLI